MAEVLQLVARPEGAWFIERGLLIQVEGEQYLLKDPRQCSNFVRYLGSSYLRLLRGPRGNKSLSELVKEAPSMKFWIHKEKREVLRVTSLDFVEIPHQWLLDLISEELKRRGEPFTVLTRETKGFNSLLFFDIQLSRTFEIAPNDTLGYRIVGWNKNDAHKALEIRAGLLRFVCANGMISGAQHNYTWIKHVYPLERVREMIRASLDSIFNEIESGMHVRILNEAREVEVYKSPFDIIEAIDPPSLKLRELLLLRIREEFKKERTLFGLSMAISWVGSNAQVTINQMRSLQRLAWFVLIPENFESLMERAEKGARSLGGEEEFVEA